MTFPLLETKINVPPVRSGLIYRSRLVDYLHAGLNRGIKLFLISAPAGSGKSTLASAWVAHVLANVVFSSDQKSLKFSWLSLYPADNEHSRFWIHLIAALQVSFPDLGESELRMLSFSQVPPLESILTSLLNQIGTHSERIVLILDDYHLITEPSIHEGISFILEHMPANMHLALVTRADPPLPLNRLRVLNQLLEIRSVDLSLTLPELKLFIIDGMGLELSEGDLAALEDRTEGWAAGVQLASVLLLDERSKAEASQIGMRLSALVTRLSGRHHLIADYLVDEVLSRQPDEIQRFLLESSILEELCAPLCDALVFDGENKTSSQSILDYLDGINLFLIPLDEEHTWFRFHHLFADVLRLRLERYQPDSAETLHQHASRWYDENGFVDRAIEHALSARDYDRVASLIELDATSLTRQGRFSAMERWLIEIPQETILGHPVLSILGSRSLVLSGKLAAAEQQLQNIEARLSNGSAQLSREVRGQIAAVRATAGILNANVDAAKEQSQLAIDLLPPTDPSRGVVLLSLGDTILMSGEIQRGIQLLRKAVEQCRQENDLSVLLTAFAHLAEGLWMQGKLRQVEEVCLEALNEVDSQLGAGNWPLPSLALIYALLGSVRREWDELTKADQELSRAVEIAEKNSYISALVNAYTSLAALRRSEGKIDQAIELVEKSINAIHKRESVLFLSVSQSLRAEYLAQAGNIQAALRWVKERDLTADRAIDYLGDFELYALTRIWIVNNQADEADALASRLVAYADASGRLGREIDFLVLQALARRQAGRLDSALQSLERALELGEEESYMRTFLHEGEPLFDLLVRISRKKTKSSAYARRILSKTETISVQEKKGISSALDQKLLFEPLTPRELVVLCQIAEGSSNQEIAERLVISVGTVKAHIYHITAKLGARSRIEAVVCARKAGLLP